MVMPLAGQIGYAFGNFGKSLMWTSLEYFLLFYLTDVIGLRAAVAGLVVLVSLLWDALINPLVGYWIDRRASQGLDYRPFLRWAPVAASVLFTAIFLTPFSTAMTMSIYLLVVLILFRSAYALFDVPHNGLLAQLPVDSPTRTRLAAMRYFFSSLGGLTIAYIAAPAFQGVKANLAGLHLWAMALVAGAVVTIAVWQSLAVARWAIVHRPPSQVTLDVSSFVQTVLIDRATLVYLAFAAAFAATAPLLGRSLAYLLHYVREQPGALSEMLVALTIGQMGAMPLWNWLADRLGRWRAGQLSMAGLAATCIALHFALHGPQVALTGLTMLFGLFNGGAVLVIWALAGDMADFIAAKSGVRADAGLLALLTFVNKAAIGVSAMTVGAALSLGDFAAGQVQAQSSRLAIEIATLGLPAAGAVAALLLLRQLRVCLDRKL